MHVLQLGDRRAHRAAVIQREQGGRIMTASEGPTRQLKLVVTALMVGLPLAPAFVAPGDAQAHGWGCNTSTTEPYMNGGVLDYVVAD